MTLLDTLTLEERITLASKRCLNWMCQI